MQKDSQLAKPVPRRASIIETVKTPLGFFTLVVLVVEAILGSVFLKSDSPFLSVIALVGAIVIVLALIGIVAYMAWHRPECLFGERRPSSSVSATVVYPPTDKSRYEKLFDGFSDCDFCAFNPPFKVEDLGAKLRDEALDVHARRYENSVRSRYLFFETEGFREANRFFDELAARIGKAKVEGHIDRVYWPDRKSVPHYTFFAGHKNGKPAIVLYPSAVMDMDSGIPRAVIYIEGAADLLAILQDFFFKQWKRALEHPTNRDSGIVYNGPTYPPAAAEEDACSTEQRAG